MGEAVTMKAAALPAFGKTPAWQRWYRPAMVGFTLLVLMFGVGLVALFLMTGRIGEVLGWDYGHYLDGTRRWLETGTPYLASEVAAPFEYAPLTFLHPPIAVLLFLPFLFLPAVLWWAIPAVVVGWFLWTARPAPWVWPLLPLPLLDMRFIVAIIVGNTDLWILAGVAAGLRFGWPALLVAVKPSLAPFIFAGIRRRSWWIGAVVLGLACLPFGALWFDWLAVVQNAPGDIGYSFSSYPWLVLLLAVWWARKDRGTAVGRRG